MAYSDQDFDDELRERLRKEAPLPPGMDWKAMRKGIKAKVGGEPESRKRPIFWWWPGIGVALLLAIAFAIYQVHQTNTLPVSGTNAIAETLPRQANPPAREVRLSAPTATPERSESDSSSSLKTTEGSHQSAAPVRSGSHRHEKTSSHPTSTFKVSTSVLKVDSSPAIMDRPKHEAIDNFLQTQNTPSKNEASIPSPSNTGKDVLADTKSINDKAAMVPYLPRYLFVAEGEFLPDLKVKKYPSGSSSKPKGWMLEVLAGTTFASSNYRGEDVAYTSLRAETETVLPGHHLSLGLLKNINERWQVRTGLAYDRYRARTDLVATSVFDSIFQSAPISISVGGDTIYGEAELRVTERREFRSFLREQRLSLPLLIGRQFRLGKGLLALRGGPEFGLLIGSGGKVLTANKRSRPLVEADFQRLRISARLEGELAFPISNDGPLLLGRVGINQVLGGGGGIQTRRIGNSLSAGIGLRVPF